MAQAPKRKDNRGGPRANAGRKKGSVDLATPEQRREAALKAREYAEEAIETLADIMRNGESESARITAANSILDRGFGKVPQAMDLGGGPEDNSANDSFAAVAALLNAVAAKRAPKESDR